MTRSTYLERRWPAPRLFQEIAVRWCADQSRLLLELVWRAYDRLPEDLEATPFSPDDEAKEETLNALMSLRIDQCRSGDEPFSVQHEVPEQTKRKRGRGKSPCPDIGFVPYESPRSVWPLEGKVLKNDSDVGDYLKEITTNFLTRRYATFSTEGAMLGYLLRGDPTTTFRCIEERIQRVLKHHPSFADRNHKVSQHQREEFQGGNARRAFCCHHLLLQIGT